MSKKDFIADYVAAVNAFWPDRDFTGYDAGRIIDAIIAGRQGSSIFLKVIAKQHGAKPGRVGNFLRGLR